MDQHHNSTLSPTNSMLITYSRRRRAVAPPIPAADRLQIPSGWGVEQVPCPNGSLTDTYYYESGTGRKFKSLSEVHRYLDGEEYLWTRSTRSSNYYNNLEHRRMHVSLHKSSKHQRMLVSGGKLLKVDGDDQGPNHLAMVPYGKPDDMSSFVLPDGWIVEEVPRRYSSWTDKYYYEPGTGRRFRSLVAVERHLSELEEDTPLLMALEEMKENEPLAEKHTKNSEKEVQENTQDSSFLNPPMEVRWVLGSSQGDKWDPIINEKSVPDAIKQQWMDKFMCVMKEGESDISIPEHRASQQDIHQG